MIANREFFGSFTVSAHPLRAVNTSRFTDLFFIFLFAPDAGAENSSR